VNGALVVDKRVYIDSYQFRSRISSGAGHLAIIAGQGTQPGTRVHPRECTGCNRMYCDPYTSIRIALDLGRFSRAASCYLGEPARALVQLNVAHC
jgi:hypothetical protein